MEDAADPIEQPAAALHRLDGVCEIRRFGRTGEVGDLIIVLGHAAVEGGREMLRPDRPEGRQLERRIPDLEERVVGHALQIGSEKALSTVVSATIMPVRDDAESAPTVRASIRIVG